MTAYNEVLVNAVTGQGKVDVNLLGPPEWTEIINRALGVLTIDFLKRLRPLKAIIEHSDRPSGTQSLVSDRVLEQAVLGGVKANAAFLLLAHISLRPDYLPGVARHILLSRDKKVYSLTITWNVREAGPNRDTLYVATQVVAVKTDLLTLLEGGAGPKLPQSILAALEFAEQETVRDLHDKHHEALKAWIEIGRYRAAVS